MKRKHTAAWLSRHSTQRSKEYDRQFARNRMKSVMQRHKRSTRLAKEAN